MSVRARIYVNNDVACSVNTNGQGIEIPGPVQDDQWSLHFQQATWYFTNNIQEHGYRFIWYKPDGTKQPARGQARIPNKDVVDYLYDLATQAGWWN